MSGSKDYALYRKDRIVMVGSLEEIAKKMKVQLNTIKRYANKKYIKDHPNGYQAFLIEEDENEKTNKK